MFSLFAAAAMLMAWETNATQDPLAWLVNVGVAGIVIILFVTGQIRTKSEVLRLESELDRANKVIDAIQQQLIGSTLPAMAKSTQVIENVPASEEALVARMRDSQRQADALIARLERLAGGGT